LNHRHLSLTAITATVILLTGCASNTYLSVYKMRLSAVDRQERGSATATSISLAEDAFDDGTIRVKWAVSNREMSLSVTNLTEQVVKIVWDEATFVGSDGTSLRLVHRGMASPADAEFSHLPSVIPRGGRIEDSVYPADLIYHSKEDGWLRRPLVTEAQARTPEEAMRLGNQKRGEALRVFLLIEVNGKPVEYNSTFTVDGVTVWEHDMGGSEPLAVQPRP
jgi:hypothetical protein